mmetsp:Transcript_1325/g.3402  ORF Transcript_1325/g.3402 Transcript_1325/m.3402 type:complete len:249 (+) Transcript_1325:72-818(+)
MPPTSSNKVEMGAGHYQSGPMNSSCLKGLKEWQCRMTRYRATHMWTAKPSCTSRGTLGTCILGHPSSRLQGKQLTDLPHAGGVGGWVQTCRLHEPQLAAIRRREAAPARPNHQPCPLRCVHLQQPPLHPHALPNVRKHVLEGAQLSSLHRLLDAQGGQQLLNQAVQLGAGLCRRQPVRPGHQRRELPHARKQPALGAPHQTVRGGRGGRGAAPQAERHGGDVLAALRHLGGLGGPVADADAAIAARSS